MGVASAIDRGALLEIAATTMADCPLPEFREPGWIYGHGIRTAKIGLHLSAQIHETTDTDVIYAAGLFHDVGKEQEPHHTIGAKMAREMLEGLMTPPRLDLVCDCIELHNQRDHDASLAPEVRIIQDADILDHIGMIETWLGFYFSGSQGQRASDNKAWIEGNEFRSHRAFMRQALNYECARTIYDQRVEWENAFFRNFHHMYQNGIDGGAE